MAFKSVRAAMLVLTIVAGSVVAQNDPNCQVYGGSGATIFCDRCRPGYYRDATQSQCQSCPSGCSSCFSSVCTSCFPGYTLNSTTSITSTGAQVQTTVCNGCGENCEQCVTATNGQQSCSRCRSNFYLNANRVCTACIANCISCSGANRCDKCAEDYDLERGVGGLSDICEKDDDSYWWVWLIIAGVALAFLIGICYCFQARRNTSTRYDAAYTPPAQQMVVTNTAPAYARPVVAQPTTLSYAPMVNQSAGYGYVPMGNQPVATSYY